MSTRLAILKNENFLRMRQAMNRSWLPADPELLERIQFSIEEGIYNDDIDALINELKKDISLFTYCLKRLSEMSSTQLSAEPEVIHPVEVLRQAGVERLRTLLGESHQTLHLTAFSRLKSYQLNRMQESVTSARTAETLAEGFEIDSDIGYASALFRQFGLTMIAWNYPRLYTKAVSELDEGKTVDQVLDRVLGFSPVLLGLSLAREWNIVPELRIALGDSHGSKLIDAREQGEVERLGRTLHKICEVSEALARAQSGEKYPGARADWLTARSEIERRLGKEGFRKLEEKIRESCSHYIQAMPPLLRPESETPLERQTRPETLEAKLSRNSYLQYCPPKVREQLRSLYAELTPDTIDKDNVRLLANDLLPAAGFTRGCFYTFDPAEKSLVPRLAIGTSAITEYATVAADADDVVADAFQKGGVRYQHDTWDVANPARILAAYGDIQRVGVLRVEVSQTLAALSEEQCMLLLKAFRQTLMDVLKLS